jgi:VWFA-related protein
MRKLLVVLLGVAAALASPAAQDQTTVPEQGPTFRAGVDVTTIDVAVVDSRGLPVEDLRAPEFSVKIDGEVRRVVSAELVKVDVEAARKQVADKTETFFTSNLTPPNGRQIVLAIDQMNIGPGAIKPVLSAASKFLDNLSPLDHVALVTYPEPGPRVGFTTDRLKLRLALEKLIGHQRRSSTGTVNLGVSEAFDIDQRRDQIVLAAVLARECRTVDPQARAQCERDVISEASDLTRRIKEDAEQSLSGLRQMLERLTAVDGPKSLILVSEGLAIDNPSELASVVELAGRARVSINVLLVDLQRGDVTISEQPPTESQDRRIQMQGLEGLATMSRGSLFHVVGTGEPIFDRLASEISAYYLLGVEQRPNDAQGGRRRIDVEVRRRGVTIRSRQAFVLSATTGKPRPPEENLRDALLSPFAVSGVPLRVTTFAQQDPESDKVRLTIAAHVDQPGAAAADYLLGFLLVDDQNRVVVNVANKRRLSPAGNSPNEPLEFVGGVLVDSGVYSLRFGVVDAQGRRGSVVRDVAAWKMAGEELAVGDLIVGGMPNPEGLQASVEPHITTDGIGAVVELYSTSGATFDNAAVTFEVADDQDSPALTTAQARLMPGSQTSWRVATGVLGGQALPPGRYVARARIVREGTPVGVLTRPFVLERSSAAKTVSPTAVAAAAVSFAGTLPKFDREAALRPELVSAMLDIVQQRSPGLAPSVSEARAGRYGPAALEALGAGDQEAAAFLRGLDLFTKGQLDQAATQLQIAAGERREFFPAAFYLGAAFAAVGRDRDAAGVWQLALGHEPRPAPVYAIVADARLRDGQPASAIDVLKPAYERNRSDDEIARRLGMAYVMTSRYAEAVPVVDDVLTRNRTDQDMLLAAIVAHYEVARAGQTPSTDDLAKLRAYATAYRGPHEALVEKYLVTLGAR